MPPQISVVVATDGTRSASRLIGSLDAQTLPSADFELVILDRGLPETERDSLRRVASRRPNIRIVESGEDWTAEAGDYVLGAQPEQKLFPDTLARLSGFAREHSLDVVAGRPVQPRQALAAPFLADAPYVEGPSRGTALTSTVVLARRDRVTRDGDPVAVDAEGASIGVLASYPASDDQVLSFSAELGKPRVDQPRAAWEAAALVVRLGGSASTVADLDTLVVVARQIGTHLTYVLPVEDVTIERVADRADECAWSGTVHIDPRQAAAGQPLPPGTWELDVILSGPDGATAPSTVPAGAPTRTALLGDVVVAVATSKIGALQLDVGPSREPVIAEVNPVLAEVAETARGSELRVRLPELHTHDFTSLAGQLGLGKLLLPAKIEVGDGEARLIAFVSGLAGRVPLSAKFGRSPLQPLGVSLAISGTGVMTVVTTPLEQSKAKPIAKLPKAKPKASKPKKRKKKAKGPVAKLRRALPEPLEPLARRLSEQPVAQKIYRRLTGLNR